MMKKYLIYSVVGILFVVVAIADFSHAAPDPETYTRDEVGEFVANKYPGARVLKQDYGYEEVKVEILHNRVKKDVVFDGARKWVHTEWDVATRSLPARVSGTIASQFAGYRIDDVDFFETPKGNYYEVELENRSHEITVHITPQGAVLR